MDRVHEGWLPRDIFDIARILILKGLSYPDIIKELEAKGGLIPENIKDMIREQYIKEAK